MDSGLEKKIEPVEKKGWFNPNELLPGVGLFVATYNHFTDNAGIMRFTRETEPRTTAREIGAARMLVWSFYQAVPLAYAINQYTSGS